MIRITGDAYVKDSEWAACNLIVQMAEATLGPAAVKAELNRCGVKFEEVDGGHDSSPASPSAGLTAQGGPEVRKSKIRMFIEALARFAGRG